MVNWFGFAALGETQEGSAVRGKIGVAPVPAGPGGRSVSLNVYWLLGVGAGSAHPEEAYGFVRHCAGRHADRDLTLGGGIGCRRSTWADPRVRAAIPFFGALEELHAGARELPRLPRWPELAAIVDRLMTQAALTRRPAAELLAEAQAQARALRLAD
jgi:multiple sugar transport system substrate-binding protein